MKNIKEIYKLPKTVNLSEERDPSLFAMYCRLTSSLIDRPYIQTYKLIASWEEHTIIRLYNDAVKADNPQKAWWGMRKKLNNKEV